MRAALYSRVSTDDQDAGNQLSELRTFCQRQGYEIYEEYIDLIRDLPPRQGFNLLVGEAVLVVLAGLLCKALHSAAHFKGRTTPGKGLAAWVR